ncbi:hypothetical protein [Pseudomonas sp. DWP3-1-2]|uniref:hypothetical protein n=1 Tax=Pseudomonas sp. DWP3-1-2 TaxID=2804645 RepID=UPI003CFADF38
MNDKKLLKVAIATALLTGAGIAQAGPEVTITFKNTGNMEAVYDVVGSSAFSYAEANPKPDPGVKSGELDVYRVKGSQSPDVTSVVFQYTMGPKICKFKTSYLNLPGRSGKAPKWNKSAQASGGARCDVNITSANMATHDWAVEFTMR